MRTNWQRKVCGACVGIAMAGTAGCTRPPDAEVEAADFAFNAATEAEAAIYAKPVFEEARTARQTLDAELVAQERRWFPSYGHARELALALKTASEKAEQSAGAGKERMRDQTAMTIAEAKVTLDELHGLLAKAPRRRAQAAELAAMRTELMNLESRLAKADDALQAGRVVEAEDQATAVMAAVQKMKASLETSNPAGRRG